jgi:hypothetical protein
VSCVNTVYSCIGLKMFFVVCNEHINENIYLHGRVKISSLLNSSLQQLRDLTPTVSLNSFLLRHKYLFAVR